MASFSLLLIDSHALLRSCLRVVLETGVPGLQVREAASVAEALQAGDAAPGVVLLAMETREAPAVRQAAPLLQQRWPDAALVLLFSSETSASLGPPPCYGATAVIARSDTAGHLLATVREALGLGPALAADSEQPAAPVKPARSDVAKPRLTPRQSEVLDLLCQGLSNKLIARRLGLSEFTVRYHVQAVFGLLQVSSRAQATFYARGSGLAG